MHDGHGHSHEHSHTHEHGHAHEHDHDHDHGDICAETSGASPKDLALLKYMLEHNKQHARELSEAGARLAAVGLPHAAVMINDAVHYFDHANEKLELAVDLISPEGD